MKLRSLLLAHPAAVLAAALLAFGVAGAAAVPVFKATEKPAFCLSCHEMKPYYDAWQVGAHKSVDCVSCHVDPGTVNHVKHKATATKELVDHFTTKPEFPRGDAVVPDARCLVCHKDILNSTGPKFSHKQHAGTAPCIQCHRDVGHQVSLDALKQAGVLNAASVPATVTTTTAMAVRLTSAGSSAAASRSVVATSALHVAIPQCTQCHNLDKQACSTCHKPLHKPMPGRDGCSTCHRPGAAWTFSHPADAGCVACHKAPASHFPGDCATCHTAPGVSFKTVSYNHADPTCTSCHTAPARHRAGQCSTCHRGTGANWSFTHPASGSCAACHQPPAKHAHPGACETCHRNPGRSWAFTHPSGGSCATCHKAPANHRSGACENCHRNAGRSWSFTHPTTIQCSSCHAAPGGHYGPQCSSCHRVGVAFANAKIAHNLSLNCASCHTPPGGHRGGQCSTCHRNPGSSWAFTHPTSTGCSSCHTPPANHFGTTCSSCHSPSRAWASATFSHPSVHHGYTAWACVKCHPNGYASHSCTTCHGPNGGGD